MAAFFDGLRGGRDRTHDHAAASSVAATGGISHSTQVTVRG